MKIYIRPLFLLFYLLVPMMSLLGAYVSLNFFEIDTLHWYIDIKIRNDLIIGSAVNYLLLSTLILAVPEYIILKRSVRPAIWYGILFVALVLYVIQDNSYVKMLGLSLVIYSLINAGVNSIIIIIFLFFGVVELSVDSSRFMLVVPLLIYVAYKGISLTKLFLIFGIFLLFFIYVLTPLKHGLQVGSFLNSHNIMYVFENLAGPLTGLIFHAENQLSISESIIESIPLAKSFLGYEGTIDTVRRSFLEIGVDGDFGSNTSGLNTGIVFIFACLNFVLLKLRPTKRIYIIYLLIMAPYFIRRSFANFFNDIIVILSICFLFFLMEYILKYATIIKYESNLSLQTNN